jgi:glycosyltransferase involved in cell wall biosynthesis
MHVSVVMGVRNGQATLADAIDSILAQTYSEWDLQIVDDASSDATWQVLTDYAGRDSRISIERNPANRGLAAALNSGWRKAPGNLIARMDADDVSFAARLQRQVDFMKVHQDVAVLGTGAELLDQNGKTVGVSVRPAEHEVLVSRIYRENPFIHPSVMIRRSFLEALGGYDPRLRKAQDYDLWFRGYRQFHYANLQEALITYRLSSFTLRQAVLYGMFVLCRSGFRDNRPLRGSWYGARYGLAALLTRFRIYQSRLR